MALTNPNSPPSYSVVIPVRDEAGNIGPLVEEIAAAMAALSGAPSYEIICVDDGSDDATPEELKAAALVCAPLTVIRHMRPTGQSQALITGIDRARGDWIVTLDGDGQNDPADIAKLIEARDAAMDSEADRAAGFLFIGHRVRRHDSLLKRYQSWLANDIRGWLLGDHTPDSGCGLKLFRRTMFFKLPRFDALHRFLPALFIRAGGRAISVRVSHRPRVHGVSKYGFWRRFATGIVDLIGVAWLIARHTRPPLDKEKDSL